MKHDSKNPGFCFLVIMVLLGVFWSPLSVPAQAGDQERVDHQIERAKIFREAYPLIAEVDLYCGIYVHDGELPDLRVVAAEREYERIMYADADIIFLNKGKEEGVEVGQVFLVVEAGEEIDGYGHLATKRGRAHVIFVEDRSSVARVEKSCGRVMVGNYLLPFEEKEILLGKDLGYEPFAAEAAGVTGRIIYLERDYNQISTGAWAIIDLGADAGLQVGQQMTIYKQIADDLPRVGIGNLIVIETGKNTSAVKILTCSDAIRTGFQVQAK